jgi:hypothetical protein
MFGLSLHPVVYRRTHVLLLYFCLLTYSGVQHLLLRFPYFRHRWYKLIFAIMFMSSGFHWYWLSCLCPLVFTNICYHVYALWFSLILAIMFMPSGFHWYWLSCLCPMIFLLSKIFKLFGFQIFWSWTYLMISLISMFLLIMVHCGISPIIGGFDP